MRRLLARAILAMACAAGTGVGAQAPASGAPPIQATPRRYVGIGCVNREASGSAPATSSAPARPRFTLTDSRGDKPTVYRLDGDEAALTFHVGHTVEVSGSLSAPPSGGGGPNANTWILKVDMLTYLSTTCPKM